MSIITRLKQYCLKALKGEATISEEYIEYFGELCKQALRKQFTEKDKTFKIRMSQIGKDVREQQGELLGLEKDEEPEYNLILKFLYGDITEAIAMVLLKASGVDIEDEQKEVKLNLAGIELEGTYDVKINNKIYDIKSCSPYAFSTKFSGDFTTVEQLDNFGYTTQLYLYSQGSSAGAGGWIVINKVTGEINVIEAPLIDDMYRNKHIKLAENNIKTLLTTTSIDDINKELPFEDELFYGKPTGLKVLHSNLQYFPYKKALWGNKIVYKANAKSKAKDKPKKWYIKETK